AVVLGLQVSQTDTATHVTGGLAFARDVEQAVQHEAGDLGLAAAVPEIGLSAQLRQAFVEEVGHRTLLVAQLELGTERTEIVANLTGNIQARLLVVGLERTSVAILLMEGAVLNDGNAALETKV